MCHRSPLSVSLLVLTAALAIGVTALLAGPAGAIPQGAEPNAQFSSVVAPSYRSTWDRYLDKDFGLPQASWHRYDRSVVEDPTAVTLTCAGEAGVRYDWSVLDPAGQPVAVAPVSSPPACGVRFLTHAEGRFGVTLTATSADQRTSHTSRVRVAHETIVSFGDSYSSGEGNPPWVDVRCHRSRGSGVARAAAGLETETRSVTFLSFACSGDEVDAGINGTSNGANWRADCLNVAQNCFTSTVLRLRAQIDAATELLCGGTGPCPPSAPRVDTVFVNIGLNDIDFSDIMFTCARKNCIDNTRLRNQIERGHRQITAGLARLAPRLAVGPFVGARVFLVLYPDDPFDTESRDAPQGCGVALRGISIDEAEFMHSEGLQLNGLLLSAAALHDWIPVPVAGRFAGHGYCSSTPMLRSVGSSVLNQGGIDGTLHPNARGHRAVADEVEAAFRRPFTPRVRVGTATVTFDSVLIHDRQATGPHGVAADHTVASVFFRTYPTQWGTSFLEAPGRNFPEHLAPIANDTPLVLPAGFQQSVPVFNKDPLVIHVNTSVLPLRVSGRAVTGIAKNPLPGDNPGGPTHPGDNPIVPRVLELTIEHSAADHYGAASTTTAGAGSHTVRRTTKIGTIELRYHVTLSDLGVAH